MKLPLRFLTMIVLPLSVLGPIASAGSVLDVASLLEHPDSYQSQVVRVSGTVSNHKIRHGATKCYQSFTLEDETGSIEAVYKANCAGARNSIRDRDVVTVEGRFEPTSRNSGVFQVRSILAKVQPSAQ
jgi:cytochrome c-type biogenesis protein CcmE